ncbi:TetR/AcrR family transcriptional regulator (plasmid) [Paraburkholderia sp. FT54]|uniref:TetR/AcrR family transcriptional regulator n=1 Tax=Paraburkholderia sp. FT54 TaxID=3074437 RepID=UPI0028772EF5|nr:TetR/AcrR family transcriptional regulator [Paraburkholderia sp. FT54]WNC95143.1 TetR/AcrR family transcriptional regulator [Paraburkholderia sp. FT54]
MVTRSARINPRKVVLPDVPLLQQEGKLGAIDASYTVSRTDMPKSAGRNSLPAPLLPGQRAVQKRRDLLAIASELFLVKGYDGVTLDEIVAAAGGSKSTIYKHFHGKEGVFVAAVEALCSEILSKIFLSKPYGGSLREALRAIGLAIYDGVLSPRAIELQRLVIAEAHRFPEVSRIWYESGPASSYRWLTAFLAERERNGEVRIFDTRMAAVLFHDMLIYEIHQQVLLGLIKKPGRAALEARIEGTIRTLLEGGIVR